MPGYKHKGGYIRTIDLKGRKFGRLLVIEMAEPYRDRKGRISCSRRKCICDCGNEVTVIGNSLKMGHTKSCGCWNRQKPSNHITHHMSNSRIYTKYKGILARCYNPNGQNYKYYGGKGICVCDEWLGEKGFENFYKWSIENGYDDSLTIERKDTSKDYEPSNCCWIPFKEQAFNKSNSYTVNGISVAKLARERNVVPPNIARERCKLGWSLEDAISIPKGGKR